MASAIRPKMTYADLEKIPPDRRRHEIIEGEWFMTPSPSLDHQRVVGNLYSILNAHVRAHGLGELFLSPVDVLLSKHNVLGPDLVFVRRTRASIQKKKYIQGAPDLVIEVTSATTMAIDRGDKLRMYRRRGIREYWIVDLFARNVEIHEFGRRPRTRIHPERDEFTSEQLPGLKIRVNDVFRKH